MNFDGYNQLFLSNVTHLMRVSTDTMQEINTTEIPDETLVSIGDFSSLWGRAYVVTHSHNLVRLNDDGSLLNTSLFEQWNVTDIEEIAIDLDRNIYFFGGSTSGITIWYRSDSITANLTTNNGLTSNHIDNLFIRAGKLFIDMPNALQVYDIDANTISWVLGLPSYSLKSIEYALGTNEIFIGAENGIHICRLSDGNWTYVKTLGSTDLHLSPDIRDLDFDITGHNMIVATSSGICTVDIYDYEVENILETGLDQFKPTCLYHKYLGSVCRIFFGTTTDGLWWIDINYAANDPTDLTSILYTILGGFVAACVGIGVSEYNRKRDRQEEERKQKMKMVLQANEQRTSQDHNNQ